MDKPTNKLEQPVLCLAGKLLTTWSATHPTNQPTSLLVCLLVCLPAIKRSILYFPAAISEADTKKLKPRHAALFPSLLLCIIPWIFLSFSSFSSLGLSMPPIIDSRMFSHYYQLPLISQFFAPPRTHNAAYYMMYSQCPSILIFDLDLICKWKTSYFDDIWSEL